MTEIYVIRHGQSQGNLQDLFLGHTDLDLTELGYQQAALAADFLDDIPVDAIYSSDLLRAYHTAEVTARRKGLPVITRQDLREIYAGKWERAVYPEIGNTWPEEFRVWCQDFGNGQCPEGESTLQTQKRLVKAVEEIAKMHPGQTVFIFGHAAATRLLTAAWMGLTPAEIQQHPWPSNGSVSHAVYDGRNFTLIQYSRDDFIGDKRTYLR